VENVEQLKRNPHRECTSGQTWRRTGGACAEVEDTLWTRIGLLHVRSTAARAPLCQDACVLVCTVALFVIAPVRYSPSVHQQWNDYGSCGAFVRYSVVEMKKWKLHATAVIISQTSCWVEDARHSRIQTVQFCLNKILKGRQEQGKWLFWGEKKGFITEKGHEGHFPGCWHCPISWPRWWFPGLVRFAIILQAGSSLKSWIYFIYPMYTSVWI